MILEVMQTASLELISRSYKRLALKLHSNRNVRHDATQAFQLICQFSEIKLINSCVDRQICEFWSQILKLRRVYETLKNESKRRVYDRIYFIITRSRLSQIASTSDSSSASTSQSAALSEAAQIAALQKSKQERDARWWIKKNIFDFSIFELKRVIRQLKQEIKNLNSIVAAEAATDAQNNSWKTWLLSLIYKKIEDNEKKKARKNRERQKRRIEKDMKKRRLELKKTDLKKEKSLLKNAKKKTDAANVIDNEKIRVIQERICVRETRERQERERTKRERMTKIWKQQRKQREKRERKATETLRKQQTKERAAEQKRQEKQIREWQKMRDDATKTYREHYVHSFDLFFTVERSTRQTFTSICRHDDWWSKVQSRTACSKCYESWTYLLQCSSCKMKTCSKCQAAIRSRRSRNAAKTNRRARSRMRTSNPDYFYDG